MRLVQTSRETREKLEIIKSMRNTGDNDKMSNSYYDLIKNAVSFGDGSVEKRAGLKLIHTFTGGSDGGIDCIIPLEKSDGTKKLMVGYEETLGAWDIDNESATESIYSGFTNKRLIGGTQFDDYVYVSNGRDGKILTWDGGATTAAITDSIKGNIISTYDRRMMVSGDYDSPYSTYYSKQETAIASTPPFSAASDWAVSTAATGGEEYKDGSGGVVTGHANIAGVSLIVKKSSSVGIRFDILDVSGTAEKSGREVFKDLGSGNLSVGGVLDSANGVYYANETGINVVVGSSGEILKTTEMSDGIKNYIKNLRFDTAKGVYYAFKDLALIACRTKTSGSNDTVLVYSFRDKSWSVFTGWNVGAWAVVGNTLYAGSSYTRKIYECFSGNSDVSEDIGFKIRTGFINSGEAFFQKVFGSLLLDITGIGITSFKVNFLLNNSNTIIDSFDINLDIEELSRSSIGVGSFGFSIWGGADFEDDLLRQLKRVFRNIQPYQNIAIEIEETSQYPFRINRMELRHRLTPITI